MCLLHLGLHKASKVLILPEDHIEMRSFIHLSTCVLETELHFKGIS